MQHAGSDRREFFRINDTVVVNYNIIEKERVGVVAKRIDQSQNHENNNEQAQLRAIQTTFSYLLDQINQNDREIGRALRMLDEKINLIAQSLQRQYNPIDPDNLTEANLSGGGIAFMVPEPLDSRNNLELYLQLLPSTTTIHAMATVISCDKVLTAPEDKPYHLRLAFTHMDEQDRNLLVKHTLNRQAEVLRGGQANDVMSLREF